MVDGWWDPGGSCLCTGVGQASLGTLCQRHPGTAPEAGPECQPWQWQRQACPWPPLFGLTAAPGAQCWQHSYLWWQEKGVPARWLCSQVGGGLARLADRADLSQPRPAPDHPLSGANPRPQPSRSASNKGDHCPLQECLHSRRPGWDLTRLLSVTMTVWGPGRRRAVAGS